MTRLPRVLVPHPHVRIDQKILGGSPYIEGSRVPVRRLFAVYKSGAAIEKILLRYPQLSPAQVFDALGFALDNPEVLEADMEREQADGPLIAPKAAGKKALQQAAFDFSGEDAESKATKS